LKKTELVRRPHRQQKKNGKSFRLYKKLVVLFFGCPQEINRVHPVLGADNDKKELQLVVTEVGQARKASKVNNPCFRSFMMVRASSRGRTHRPCMDG
jgi:hypothetical protein